MLKDFVDEYARYRMTGERALQQMSDDALNRIPIKDGNSAAMVVRHVGGNLLSRFTDFLAADGEKPWRDRDREFDTRSYTRVEADDWWKRGWNELELQLSQLTDADLSRTVTIRGQALTVHAALSRSLAHVAMHVGQIIVLARMYASDEWKWITIPKGQSAEYNLNPTKEKRGEERGANERETH